MPPEPATQGGTFIHELIGLSPSGFRETVRNSFSSLTRREEYGTNVTPAPPPDAGVVAEVRTGHPHAGQTRLPPPPSPPPAPEPCPRHLLNLPHEIWLMILERLAFADIVRLRRTCKRLRTLADPKQIRDLLGPVKLHAQLLSHCKVCLLYDPFRSHLLRSTRADPGYPLASRCITCAMKARDPRVRVGKMIDLANLDTARVCRWCGTPIIDGGAFGCAEMHRFCYKRYNDVLFVFFWIGWTQLGLGIVAAALAWRYYRHAILVFAPTVASFIILWIPLALLACSHTWGKYHYMLGFELVILGLWVPPIYYVASEIATASGGPIPSSTQASLAMFALNMAFRLMNVVGNLVIFLAFDTTKRNWSDIPVWKRLFHYLATAFVMWTCPQSLEQMFPPNGDSVLM
ncbi:uncharacterized protein B0H64DRAFT_441491 [Chaetomium fimeti]|uniref:F-box domain-containing protein n=1 Tax=Chaetomium fimeti TaxID=1854472 RepID=A0AAE0HKX4_9PEZI|nr:hypothetical protein B0H64DRAFT_441491 [Chaetomium fimeti]